MLILDITNWKSVDVHLVFFSKKQQRNKPAAISSHPKPTKKTKKIPGHNLRAQGSCTFQVCQPQIFMNEILQVEYQQFTHSIQFIGDFYHLFTAIVLLLRLGFIQFNSLVISTIFFLNSYFFSLLNR